MFNDWLGSSLGSSKAAGLDHSIQSQLDVLGTHSSQLHEIGLIACGGLMAHTASIALLPCVNQTSIYSVHLMYLELRSIDTGLPHDLQRIDIGTASINVVPLKHTDCKVPALARPHSAASQSSSAACAWSSSLFFASSAAALAQL